MVVEVTGGSSDVRDQALVEAAVHRPRQTFGGDDLYTTLWAKAAALFESIISNHPFVDGNKRTAMVASLEFLERNGFTLTTSNHELETFALTAAQGSPGVDELAEWFEAHSAPV